MSLPNCLLLALAVAFASCDRQTPLNPATVPKPDSAVLLAPSDGARLSGSAVDFRWQRVEDADSVTLEIAVDSSFHYIIFRIDVNGTAHRLSHLFAAPRHHWRLSYISKATGLPVRSRPFHFDLIDSTRDIDFRDPQVGQYSEWQGVFDAWTAGPKIGMRVVSQEADTFVLAQYRFVPGFGTDSTRAFLIADSGGLFYTGSLFPFDLVSKPETSSRSPGFLQGFRTTSQACPERQPHTPIACYTAKTDSAHRFRDGSSGRASILTFEWPMEYESLSNTKFVLDDKGRLVETFQFGFNPYQNPNYFLLPL